MILDFCLQFSFWRNTAWNQKPQITGQGYILIYTLITLIHIQTNSVDPDQTAP